MEIKIKEKEVVSYEKEVHYKVSVNGKEVWVTKWFSENNISGYEGDTEIFKGEELLTDEEKDAVITAIQEGEKE